MNVRKIEITDDTIEVVGTTKNSIDPLPHSISKADFLEWLEKKHNMREEEFNSLNHGSTTSLVQQFIHE